MTDIIKRLILNCFVFLFLTYSFAQNNKLEFKRLDTGSGLIHNRINSIAKDSMGYLWFGTLNGLNRYDGFNYKNFTHHIGDSSSLAENYIETLFVDNEGDLWAGTNMNGLSRYIPENESFIHYKYKGGSDECLAGETVVDIEQLPDGRLIIGTSGGISVFDKEKQKFVNWRHDFSDPQSLVHDKVGCVFIDHLGKPWIGTVGGLSVMDIEKQIFKNYIHQKNNKNSLSHNTVISITQTADSIIWIGTTDGLNKLNTKTDKIVRFYHEMNNEKSILDDFIHSLEVDNQGNLWVGTTEGISKIVNPNTNNYEYHQYEYNASDLNSISGNQISDLYFDRDEMMWVGTINDGVNYCYLGSSMFHTETHSPILSTTLSHNTIRSVFEDSKGNLWVGTDGGGLNFMPSHSSEFIRFDALNEGKDVFGVSRLLDIYESNESDIWIGTWGGGASKFSIDDIELLNEGILPSVQRYPFNIADSTGIACDIVQDIFQDSYNNIWLGTENGISIYNPSTNTFYTIRHQKDNLNSLCDNRVQSGCIFEDKEQNIWIGTWNGLSIIKRSDIPFKNGILIEEAGPVKFNNYLTTADDIDGSGDNRIISITEDHNRDIWIGTFGGGMSKAMLNDDTLMLEKYTTADGLPDNVVYGIEKGLKNELWVSSNNGLSQFNYQTGEITNYGKGEGVQGDEFYWGAHCRRKDGQLLFGGINGLTFFHPDSIMPLRRNKPIITGMSIFNVPVNFKNSDSPLKKPIELTKKIVLSHNDKVVSFDYTCIDFLNGSELNFSYILEGFEETWNDVGARRTAIYTNLEPGNYVFKVKVSDSRDEQEDAITSLNITIKTPYYQTPLFRSVIVLIVIFLVIFIYRLNLSQIKRQKKRLEEKVEERTRELMTTNRLLVERNEEVITQRDRIITQNKELTQHREGLELLVQARTKELVLAKNKAEESDRLKSAFLANMSHEIRTPLNAVVGFSGLLNDKDIDAESREIFVKQINQNSDDLLVLIDDIIDLSHIEANQIKLRRAKVDVVSFFYSIADIYRNKILDLNFRVLNQCEDEVFVVVTDPQRVRQIIVNLLNNAFKFTEKGFVEFGMKKLDGNILFYVKDSGIGISKENQELIFDRFRKVDANEAKLYRGNGLGLTISKKLAELLNADLYVESALAKGSTFYLRLPVSAIKLNNEV